MPENSHSARTSFTGQDQEEPENSHDTWARVRVRTERFMQKSEFTEAQIAFVLKHADEGTAVVEIYRKAKFSSSDAQ